MPLPPNSPRALAHQILRDVEEGDARVREATNLAAETASLSAVDRGLLRELTAGVTRRRLALDTVIDCFSKLPVHKLEAPVRRALQIGLYQMLYLDRIPTRAAVDTTVDLVRAVRPQATGFTNAILRNASRAIIAVEEDPGQDPRRALPIDRRRYAIFDRDLLPDPEKSEAEHLACAHSHPLWMVERWLGSVGPETTLGRLRVGNGRPQTFLRIRPGRGDELRAGLRAAGEPFAEVEAHPDAIRLEREVRIASLPGYKAGWFVVQDLSAQAVAAHTATAAGESVLDVGAAPGGKTAALADLVGPTGKVIALDLSHGRLRRLAATRRRLGLAQVHIVTADARHDPFGSFTFDRVLVDAPCSNSGVLRRRVEARWRLDLETIRSLSVLQTELVVAAADRVRPGGTLVYSTCALEEEENAGVVEAVLRARPDLALDDATVTEPGAGDGGYLARLTRRE